MCNSLQLRTAIKRESVKNRGLEEGSNVADYGRCNSGHFRKVVGRIPLANSWSVIGVESRQSGAEEVQPTSEPRAMESILRTSVIKFT